MHTGRIALTVLMTILLSACGGGGGSFDTTVSTGPATVGILITDAASDDFDEAIAHITSVTLLCEGGQQTIFSGSATYDLFQLKDFVELLAIDDNVQPDTCSKIRLRLDSLDLNVLNDDGTIDETESVAAKLVANGKIDLKSDEPFTINRGERIAQMVIAPITQPEFTRVEILSETARGEGGFGSTGTR